MTEKIARKLAIGDRLYHIIGCYHGVVTWIEFAHVTVSWENRTTTRIAHSAMGDIEHAPR